MRAFPENLNREDREEMGSGREGESRPERGERELEELVSDFISAPDPNSPDLDVVSRLYLEFFRHFVRVFERKANDRRRAQDAVQEAFAALQAHYNTHGALPRNPKAFLFSVARHWLVDQARKEAVRREVPLGDGNAAAGTLADPSPHAREAIVAMESEELKAVAYPVVEQFDETTRKIIELRRQGKEWDEIAGDVGLQKGGTAKMKYLRAIRRVKRALSEHFSSFVSSADPDERRWVNSRRSAERAIDLLPPPYNKILRLILVEKRTEKEVAARLSVSPEEVRRSRERALELFHKQYKMTEDDLLDLIWHSGA